MLGPGYRFSLLSDEALCSSCAGVPRIIRKLLWQQRSGTMRMGPPTETVEFPSSSKSSEKNTVHPACLAARLMSASENEKLCNRWKIDSGQDIIAVGTEDIELRQEFELQSESQGLVYVYRHKIFLQNLHPDNITTTTSAFCYGSEGHCATWSGRLNHRYRRVRWCQKTTSARGCRRG